MTNKLVSFIRPEIQAGPRAAGKPANLLHRLPARFDSTRRHPKSVGMLWRVGPVLLMLTCLAGRPAVGADDSGIADKTKQVAQEASAAVQQVGDAVSADAGELWRRIDEARLKHRAPDEIVAWAIMGVLVGAVAGMITLKATRFGKLGLLLTGLVGAFVGGIVVRVAHLDFGWGPVLIRYEELAASFAGAILLFLLVRLVRFMSRKKDSRG